MVNTVGRVDFTARIDGRRTPRDAEKIGRDAGKAGADEFDDAWSKGFRETLDKNARAAFDRWKKSGKADGGIYGGTFARTFTPYIKQAQKTFDQLRVNPGFLDGLKGKFGDAAIAVEEVQKQLVDLNREGEISDRVFAGARRQVDDWATAQRKSAEQMRLSTQASDEQQKSVQNLTSWIDDQRSAYEKLTRDGTDKQRASVEKLTVWLRDQRDAYDRVTRASEENVKAFNLERRNRYNQLLAETRQRLVDNVAVHIRSTEALRAHIARVGDAGVAYRQFSAYLEQYRTSAGGADSTYLALSANLDKATSSMHKSRDASDGMNFSWAKIPHNGRQVILIAAAIAGGFEQIAVLGSAAGAGLLIFGSALGGILVGLGATVAAFAGLGGEIEDLPESVRPAAKAFQDLKTPLQELQDLLQERAFANAAPAFESLGDTIRKITPAFGVMGDAISRIIDGFTRWAASEAGIRLLTGLVTNSARIFEKFSTVAGKLGEILLEIFNNPAIQKGVDSMLDGLGSMFDELNTFVRSERFTTWIESSMSILSGLGDLIGATSQLFNDLVTPEAQQRTEEFLQNLTDMMDPLGELIDVFGELDIFGVLASMLNDLLTTLTPLFEILQPIASILRDGLITSFSILTTVLGILSPLLLPIQIAFEVIAGWLSRWAEYLAPFIAGFQTLNTAFQDATDRIMTLLAPAFDTLWQAIIDLLPTAEQFTTWINNYAVPAIEAFATWLGTEGAQAIEDFAGWLQDEAVPAMKKFWDWLSTKVIPIVIDMSGRFIAAGRTIGTWVGAVKTALSILSQPIRFAIDLFNRLAAAAGLALGSANAAKNAGGSLRDAPAFAAGGMLGGPRYILAGEDGPEAIVPLRRALDRVDPSVRWLSAIAQGKTPTAASGGITGNGGRAITIEAGAIVVEEARDGLATSVEVLNRISENLD